MTKITFSALCVSVLLASACAELSEPVYTVDGKLVRSSVSVGEATKGLIPGVYVVGGKKIVVR